MPLTAVRRSTHGGESRHTTYTRGVTGKMPGAQRRRKIEKDAIHGITRPAIRRLARRGGVKRISAGIYEDVRAALTMRLKSILRLCVIYIEHRGAKTITLDDVFFSLKRQGQLMYGYGLGSTMEPRVAARQSRNVLMRR